MKTYIKSNNYATSQEYFEETTEKALKYIIEAEKLFNELKQSAAGELYTACDNSYRACQEAVETGHQIYKFFNPENYW